MEVTVEIIDKVYDEIAEMCELNNISVEYYIVTTVMDDYYIMKYGDLNEKIAKKNEVVEEPKKKTTKSTPKPPIIEETKVETPIIEDKKEEIVVSTQEPAVKKIRKRTLVSK